MDGWEGYETFPQSILNDHDSHFSFQFCVSFNFVPMGLKTSPELEPVVDSAIH